MLSNVITIFSLLYIPCSCYNVKAYRILAHIYQPSYFLSQSSLEPTKATCLAAVKIKTGKQSESGDFYEGVEDFEEGEDEDVEYIDIIPKKSALAKNEYGNK